MRAPPLTHRRSYFRRRAVAARRMRALGYALPVIARLLALSPGRVRAALRGESAMGRLWTDTDRAALAREMGRGR